MLKYLIDNLFSGFSSDNNDYVMMINKYDRMILDEFKRAFPSVKIRYTRMGGSLLGEVDSSKAISLKNREIKFL